MMTTTPAQPQPQPQSQSQPQPQPQSQGPAPEPAAFPDGLTLPDPGARASFGAELLKLRSVPSIGVMLAVAVGLTALLSLLSSHNQSLAGPTYLSVDPGVDENPGQMVSAAVVDPTGVVLAGNLLGAALFAAFGAIAGALEYTSGMIRISLATVPRRTRFFLTKAAAVAATAAIVATVTTLVCFLVGESYFDGQPQSSATLTSPGVPLHLVGAVLGLTGWALIGFAFGALLRSTALGVTISFVLYIAMPLMLGSFDGTLANDVTPLQTSQALFTYRSALNPNIAPFGLALAVFCAYVVGLLGAALARTRFTDA